MKYLDIMSGLRYLALVWCFSRVPVPFGMGTRLFDFGMGQKGKKV